MGYRYIGSKARIADSIIEYLGTPKPEDGYFIDAFSGTGIVASIAADHGWKIKVNDMMLNAAVISEARLLSKDDVSFSALGGYENALEILNEVKRKGFIWREYSPASFHETGIERRYFTETNAQKIDGIVDSIQNWKKDGTITSQEFTLLAATLILATNNVANIAGTYGCFLSKWQPQALETLTLQPLELRDTTVEHSVSTDDVFDVQSTLNDVVYLDPPYTKRQYASYYHILETIVLGDNPIVAGVSGLRPWKSKASVFCYKVKALRALVDLTTSQKAKRVLISYSNDGHIHLDQLVDELEQSGTVDVVEIGSIARYRPNQTARTHKPEVKEYLIDYKQDRGLKSEQTINIGAVAFS